MRTRIMKRVATRHRWDRLMVSFWFAPALMALAAVLLAWAMYQLDNLIPNEALENSRLILSGTVGELRSSLLNMAGTILATAGVVFTLLTLPLSTVAAQYGSRLLRIFMRDRTTQFVLGMFVATFVYCVAAALSILPVEVQPDGPQLTATVGLYLELATFASLILLVQHISTMLQAPNVAAGAGAELLDVVNAMIPADMKSGDDSKAGLETHPNSQGIPDNLAEVEGYSVRVRSTGYIQFIDTDSLLYLTREKNLVIRLLHKPGQFVSSGIVVALVWPANWVDGHLDQIINSAFQIGSVRTPTQDVEYAVNQLTEMAVRAMSPAINDPFTAMTCLDHMGNGLVEFIRQSEKGFHHSDRDGRLQLASGQATFDTLLSAAFDMLRHASCNNANVLLHMLEVIDAIGQESKALEVRQLLIHHVNLIQAESRAGDLIEQDRQSIHRSVEVLQRKFEDEPAASEELKL
jgi:uncharacterized membrane protein